MQRDTLTQEPYRSEVRPQQEEDTIDLLELCMGLLDHWKFIAAAAAAGAVLAALYTFLLVTPLYKATSTIYVVSRNDSVLNLSDIQIGSALTSDYIKVFEMWEVHEKVISALDLDYTYTQMDNMLSVTNANDTRMLDITVTDADPEEAAAIANKYAEVGASYIAEKMKTDEPTIMSSASPRTSCWASWQALCCPAVWWCCECCWTIPINPLRRSASTPAWWCWPLCPWWVAPSPKRAATSSAA